MIRHVNPAFKICLLCGIFAFFAQGRLNAQITFNASNKTIQQVIEIIENEADYSFFYTDKLTELKKTISISADNESIETVLNKLFKGTDISYKIEPGKQIALSVKSTSETAMPQQKKIFPGTGVYFAFL